MAHAFGYGHAFGFGLGFLNFIGTLVFFFFMIWALKMVFAGSRFGPGRSCGGHWRQKMAERYRHWSEESDAPAHHPDGAMKVARDRLASSELRPEEFETIKQGLKDSQPEAGDHFRRHDSALATARLRFAKGELSREEFDAVRKALA
ncbi:MAG: SHOCT domain-containing protein [Trueperaceae bacterium]|nr:SHOCT domain-containing protein [Trueperaceae bacterium]